MTVSIHQPNFLPWLGYFYKIAKSDMFVLLDDVQFTKNGFTNRNRIKTPQGELWLTLPIVQSGKFGQNINECAILNKKANADKILKTIKSNYAKSKHFDWLYPDLEVAFQFETDNLAVLNERLIRLVVDKLEIKTPLMLSSALPAIEGMATERLVNICKHLNASKYLFGFGAANYQEDELFIQNNVEPARTKFVHPVYTQLWKEFIPNMSVIDYLFNVGPDSKVFMA